MNDAFRRHFGRFASRLGQSTVLRWTLAGTIWCTLVSLSYMTVVAAGFGGEAFRSGLPVAALLLLVLAGPVLLFLGFRLRELARANQKLGLVASTDSLTACLNRGAFSTRVDESLSGSGRGNQRIKGALLVIDADHFKSINDSYGHDLGDEALRVIAAAIRGQVRKDDLVGRLGGEEFGVFLPGATQQNAVGVAERIRRSISELSFRPMGTPHRLTVSVGGVSFEDQLGFVELFRIADRRLYQAKNSGRNRIELTHIQAYNISDLAVQH
ncbi:MAG: GGDEF domain-containing protein [Nitratireductor sp.]